MPVLRKRNHWHGLALECPVVLDATSPLYAMRCFSYKLRAHKPRLRPIRCHSWRVDSTLSTFASLCLYNTTHLGPKTCKVSKEKGGAIAPPCVGSEEFVFSARCSIEFDGRLAAAHASIVFDDAEVIAEGTLHFLVV